MSADSADSRGSPAEFCFQSCLGIRITLEIADSGRISEAWQGSADLSKGIRQLEREGDRRFLRELTMILDF